MTPQERAVIEAARAWRDWELDHSRSMVDRNQMWDAVDAALNALDALPADPPEAAGETVEVAVWEDKDDGEMQFCRAGGGYDKSLADNCNWLRRLGTVRLPVIPATTPPLPVIPATVEPKP